MKLTEAVERFYKVNSPVVSSRTVETHCLTLDRNFLPFILENYGDLSLQEITREHIRAFQNYLVQRKRKGPGRKYSSILQSSDAQERKKKGLLSLWTVKHHMATVKRLFNWLVEEGILDPGQSPILGVKTVNPGTTAAGSIPREAIIKMMQVASGPPLMELYKIRDQAIEVLMFAPGPTDDLVCGSGELSRLCLQDIKDGRLLLRSRSFEQHVELVVYFVELRPSQEAALNRWLRVRPDYFSTPHVFVNMSDQGKGTADTPMTQKMIGEICHRLRKKRNRPNGEMTPFQIRNAAMVALLGLTGPEDGQVCRPGELSRLKLDDIDGQWLRLESFVRVQKEVTFEIALTAEQEQALNAWLQVRPPGFDSDHVFVTLDNRGGEGAGGPMPQKSLYRAYLTETNRTAAERRSRQEVIERDTVWAARRLALLLVFLDTGARLGGVMGLTLDRLDLETRRAVVLEKWRGGPKARTVFFSEITADALKKWLRLDNRKNQDTIFGMKGNEFRARDMLATLAEQAGVEGVPTNPHAFRHSYARFMIEGGADLSQTSRLMGHSSIKVTSDFYIHWDAKALAAVHEKASPVTNLAQRRPDPDAAAQVPG